MGEIVINQIHIRWLLRRDMPEVLNIEFLSFENCWKEEDFLTALRNRNTIGVVATIPVSGESEIIAGYMIYELHKGKFHILNTAVHPDYRRTGIGRQMIERLIKKLSPPNRNSLETVIREKNLEGQLFLRACGLRCGPKAVLKNYFDNEEDGYLMHYVLGKENENVKYETMENPNY